MIVIGGAYVVGVSNGDVNDDGNCNGAVDNDVGGAYDVGVSNGDFDDDG